MSERLLTLIEQKPPYALRHTFASMQADGDTNMVALRWGSSWATAQRAPRRDTSGRRANIT